jgi:hypothetical protein
MLYHRDGQPLGTHEEDKSATFKSLMKFSMRKVGLQVIRLNGEGNLLVGCLIVARSRPESRPEIEKPYGNINYTHMLGASLPTVGDGFSCWIKRN